MPLTVNSHTTSVLTSCSLITIRVSSGTPSWYVSPRLTLPVARDRLNAYQIWRLWIIWGRKLWLCIPFVRTVLRRNGLHTLILTLIFVLIPQIVLGTATGGEATSSPARNCSRSHDRVDVIQSRATPPSFTLRASPRRKPSSNRASTTG